MGFTGEGNTSRTHDDVPEDICQLLREQEELLSKRKRRKRKGADDLPAVNIHLCCRVQDQDSVSCNARLHPEVTDVTPKRRAVDSVIPKPGD